MTCSLGGMLPPRFFRNVSSSPRTHEDDYCFRYHSGWEVGMGHCPGSGLISWPLYYVYTALQIMTCAAWNLWSCATGERNISCQWSRCMDLCKEHILVVHGVRN